MKNLLSFQSFLLLLLLLAPVILQVNILNLTPTAGYNPLHYFKPHHQFWCIRNNFGGFEGTTKSLIIIIIIIIDSIHTFM